jgi:hypothetical protein
VILRTSLIFRNVVSSTPGEEIGPFDWSAHIVFLHRTSFKESLNVGPPGMLDLGVIVRKGAGEQCALSSTLVRKRGRRDLPR